MKNRNTILTLAAVLCSSVSAISQNYLEIESLFPEYNIDDRVMVQVDQDPDNLKANTAYTFGSFRDDQLLRKPFIASIDANNNTVNWSVALNLSDKEDYEPRSIATDPIGEYVCVGVTKHGSTGNTSIVYLIDGVNGTIISSKELSPAASDGWYEIHDIAMQPVPNETYPNTDYHPMNFYIGGAWRDHGEFEDKTSGFIVQLNHDLSLIDDIGIGDANATFGVVDDLMCSIATANNISSTTQTVAFAGYSSTDNYVGQIIANQSGIQSVTGTGATATATVNHNHEVLVKTYYSPLIRDGYTSGYSHTWHAGALRSFDFATYSIDYWGGLDPDDAELEAKELGLHSFKSNGVNYLLVTAQLVSATEVYTVSSLYNESTRTLINRTYLEPQYWYYHNLNVVFPQFEIKAPDEISDMHNNQLFLVTRDEAQNRFRLYIDYISPIGDPITICDEYELEKPELAYTASKTTLSTHALNSTTFTTPSQLRDHVVEIMEMCELGKKEQETNSEPVLESKEAKVNSTMVYTLDGTLVIQENSDIDITDFQLGSGVYVIVKAKEDGTIETFKQLVIQE